MKIILLGAPGAGKGTQSEYICEKYKIPSISTGNILREAMKNGTELGAKVKSFMESGQLVPDSLILDIIKERLTQPDCDNGFILDGVPRTVVQAKAIEALGISIDTALVISVEDAEIIERLSNRRVCTVCGASYHLTINPPQTDGVCDKCSGKVIVRTDDNERTVKDRLKVYHTQTEPLINYYKEKGILKVVKSEGGIEKTARNVLKALEAK